MYGKWLYKEIGTEYGACKVEIYRKNYTGESIEIGALAADSLSIALENLGNITDPIGKSVCSFSIIDTDQVEYDDFFTPDATALKVVVSTRVGNGAYVARWSGYVTPDFFAENLSYRTPISISARDNIGYLNDVDFDLTATTITVRELIQSAFRRIAEDYPMSLSFATQKQTAEGILAIDATISTTLLGDMTWGEALETILHDLGLQMRWVDNNTIAVLDLSQIPEYYQTQGFNFIEASGYREIVPAWRELSQEQDYGLRENFFEGKMTAADLSFAKTQSLTIPDLGFRQDVMYYRPTNWGVARDIFTTDPSLYNSTFGNRLIFSAVSETNPDTTYLSWSTDILKSDVPLTVKCKALNSVIYPFGGVKPYSLQLKVYDPFLVFGSREGDHLQIGIRVNLFLHTRDNKTYVMNKEWVEDNGTGSGNYINLTMDKVSLDTYNVIEGEGAFPIGMQPQEQELTITANTIPYDGTLELRIYGYYVVSYSYADENIQSPNFDKFFTYIDGLTYTFEGNDISTGQESKVQVSQLHNVKDNQDYSFGEVPLDCGGINAYAGGLFKADGNELIGFQRNADATNYNLLELVGRELIHFNKKNYNRLSGTIRNLNKEPLMFNRLFVREGKKYAPYNYSLSVISNEMNITSMQEVEPYETATFNTIDSQITTGGGTVSGGNNTILQYSEEAGNEKRLYELQTATEQEKSDAYVLVDKAGFPEARKVHVSELGGIDVRELEQYLEKNGYTALKTYWTFNEQDDTLRTTHNIVVEGGGAFGMGAESGDIPSASVSIKFDGSNIVYSPVDGIITLPAYPSAGGGVADSVAWSNVTGKPTTLGGYGITDALSTSGGTIAGALKIGTQGELWYGSNGEPYLKNTTTGNYINVGISGLYWNNTNQFLTDANYYNYALPLSGGVLDLNTFGEFVINSKDANVDRSAIIFKKDAELKAQIGWDNYMSWGTYMYNYLSDAVLGIKNDGTPHFNGYPLYHTGNFNPADYLPLSGGTIEGGSGIYTPLTIKNTSLPEVWIGFQDSVGTCYIGSSAGVPSIYMGAGNQTIIHSGNIGSQSVNYANSAGLIGYSSVANLTHTALQYWFDWGESTGIGVPGSAYKWGIHIGSPDSNYNFQIGATSQDNTLYARFKNGGTVYGWREIAFTDSNVASATKLQTARSIWGQSFDGTGDVNGYMYVAGPALFNNYNVVGNNPVASIIINKSNDYFGIGPSSANVANMTFGLCNSSWGWSSEQMVITDIGNILIGTTYDGGHRLLVAADNDWTARLTSTKSSVWFAHSGGYGMALESINNTAGTYLMNIMYGVSSLGYNDGITAFRINDNGNVLISTTSDNGHRLNVAGRINGTGYHLDNTDAIYCGLMPYNMISSGGDLRGIWLYNTAGLHFYGSIIEFVNSVNIAGNLAVTGGGAFGSDIRYKDITSYRQLDLETIINAPLFTFKWTDREDKVEHLGTSAQYWLGTQFKDAVNTANKDFFHLDYGALAVGIGISVAREVKVVKTEVEVLRERVNQLEKELAQYRRA